MEQTQEPTVTLTLPLSAVNLILTGLAELPLKQSAPLFGSIQSEITKLLQPQPAKAEEDERV